MTKTIRPFVSRARKEIRKYCPRETGLVMLMVIYAPALLLMYVVIWLTSPFRNKIVQVSAAFASILAITHLAGVVFEAVAVLGAFAVDLLTGQVAARMDKRERNKLAKAA